MGKPATLCSEISANSFRNNRTESRNGLENPTVEDRHGKVRDSNRFVFLFLVFVQGSNNWVAIGEAFEVFCFNFPQRERERFQIVLRLKVMGGF